MLYGWPVNGLVFDSALTASLGQPSPVAASAGAAGMRTAATSVNAAMAPIRPRREVGWLSMFVISLELHSGRVGHCLLAHREARSELGLLAVFLRCLAGLCQGNVDLVAAGLGLLLGSRLQAAAADLDRARGRGLDGDHKRAALEPRLRDLYRRFGSAATGDGDLRGLREDSAVLSGDRCRHRELARAEVGVRGKRGVRARRQAQLEARYWRVGDRVERRGCHARL